jgi:hypothetical protein
MQSLTGASLTPPFLAAFGSRRSCYSSEPRVRAAFMIVTGEYQ